MDFLDQAELGSTIPRRGASTSRPSNPPKSPSRSGRDRYIWDEWDESSEKDTACAPPSPSSTLSHSTMGHINEVTESERLRGCSDVAMAFREAQSKVDLMTESNFFVVFFSKSSSENAYNLTNRKLKLNGEMCGRQLEKLKLMKLNMLELCISCLLNVSFTYLLLFSTRENEIQKKKRKKDLF